MIEDIHSDCQKCTNKHKNFKIQNAIKLTKNWDVL